MTGENNMAEIIRNPDMPGGSTEDRVAALEKKMKEMEALVKGLTEELLDLKSIAMRLNKFSEERRQELKMMKPTGQGDTPGSTVIMQKKVGGTSERAPAPVKEEKHMDMIMQPDGTMKLEERRGDNQYIVASAGFSTKKKMGSQQEPKRNNLIVAEDDEKGSEDKK
jgi:hypothetical protein